MLLLLLLLFLLAEAVVVRRVAAAAWLAARSVRVLVLIVRRRSTRRGLAGSAELVHGIAHVDALPVLPLGALFAQALVGVLNQREESVSSRTPVALAAIGVVLQRQLPVALLYFAPGARTGDVQSAPVVALHQLSVSADLGLHLSDQLGANALHLCVAQARFLLGLEVLFNCIEHSHGVVVGTRVGGGVGLLPDLHDRSNGHDSSVCLKSG
mmetsp:Transcript_26243/g.49631  ORF Transcript_26243/g.49631 Transcript_26243/m.49631 type:complete len:211 (-) Transcript_26243:125-757(-)